MKICLILGVAIVSSVFSSQSSFAVDHSPDYPVAGTPMVHIGNPDQYAFKISPVGGINWATTTQTDVTQAANQAASFSQSSGLGYAVGLLVAYSPIPVWDLETGVIFSHHKTNYSDNFTGQVGSGSTTYNNFEFPIVARYSFVSFLSAGAGMYYARSIGPITLNSTIPGISSGTASFNNSKTNANDIGFVFNARATAPLSNSVSLFLDARYLLGLTNINQDGNPNDNFNTRELQILAGLGFGF